MHDRPGALSRTVLLAYAAPAFSQVLIHGPANSIIQGIYAKEFGVSLQAIAGILLIAGLVDVVTNPLIGYCSDRYRIRHGSRKPWLLVGAAFAVVACWFLYAPTPPVTAGYFLGWLLLAYFAWSVSEIPYGAWIAEISDDYDQRTRLSTWRAIFAYGGSIVFFAVPFLPIFPTTEFTADTLRWTAIIAGIALPAMTLLAVALVPNGTAPRAHAAQASRDPWRAVFLNRPLLLYASMFALIGLANGVLAGVLFFFFDSYLDQGKAMAGIFLVALPVGALAVPVWGYLCRKFGKHRAWAAGTAATAVSILGYGFVPVGSAGTWLLTVVHVLVIASYVSYAVASPAVLADVVDYGRWRFGADFGGTYFSFYSLMYKAAPQVGAALGIAMLGWFGFDPQARILSAEARSGLLLVFCVVPAVMLAIATVLVWRFPIDARRQAIIARRLARSAAPKPATEPG